MARENHFLFRRQIPEAKVCRGMAHAGHLAAVWSERYVGEERRRLKAMESSAGGEVHHLYRLIFTGRSQQAAVGTEGDGPDHGLLPADGGFGLPGRHLPEVDAAVLLPPRKRLTVGAESQDGGVFGMSRQGANLLAAGHVPQHDGAVVAARGEYLPVRAEHHGPNLFGVKLFQDAHGRQRVPGLPVGQVPESDGVIRSARSESAAVRTDGHA